MSYVKWTMWSDCSLKIRGKNAPLDSGNLNCQKNSLKLFFVLSFLFQREMNHNSRISKFDLHCIVFSNQLSLVVPGEKSLIFEDLQGLSKTCQRSLKTRIFKGSVKDLQRSLKIFVSKITCWDPQGFYKDPQRILQGSS